MDDMLCVQFVGYVEYWMNEWMNERMNISVDDSGVEIAGKGLEVEKWKTVIRVFDEAT